MKNLNAMRLGAGLLSAGCALVLAASVARAHTTVVTVNGGLSPVPVSNLPVRGVPYFPGQQVSVVPGGTFGTPSYSYPNGGSPVFGVPVRNGHGQVPGDGNVVIVGDNTRVYVDNRGAVAGYPSGYPAGGYPGYGGYPAYGGVPVFGGYPTYGAYPGTVGAPVYTPGYPVEYGYNDSYNNGYNNGYSDGYNDGTSGYYYNGGTGYYNGGTGYYNGGTGYYNGGTYGSSTTSVFGQFSLGGGGTRVTVGGGQQQTRTHNSRY